MQGDIATKTVGKTRLKRLVCVMLAAGSLGAGLTAAPAHAFTGVRNRPVLMIHGYNPTSNSTDCAADFSQMITQMQAEGYTGPFVKVGFYSGDVNCNVNLRNYGSFSNSSSWKLIAKAFSTYVYNTYTVNGQTVDVVGYSMGGLIARGAVYGASNGQSGFSAPIKVEDGVTLGTPHNGAAWYSALCLWGQCTSLKPGATDITWLNGNGNPQGVGGTDWTTVGSIDDAVTPSASAAYMTLPSTNKVTYSGVSHTGSTNYMHQSVVITRADEALANISQ